ncbi:MAG: T9SS type A sorting domain-containing protein [Bacteroidales bacterium]|nr:T9SS type A sorting domain-containing protein [Bacteroidales bacterium]
MKKYLLTLSVLCLALMARSGNVFIFEQFDNSYLPAGWSVVGSQADYWQLTETSHAGGSPYEVEFYCNVNGTWRLTTDGVDLTGVESVNFSFKHYYDMAMGASLTVGIATKSGNEWHSGWSQTYNSGGQYQVNATIATEDMGKPNVRFCIYFTNSNDMNFSYIYVDDISAFIEQDLDLDLQEINVEEVQANRVFDVGMRLFNTGNYDVTSVECSYQFDDNQVVTQTFNESIPSGTFKNLTFDVPANIIPDDYSLTININKVNGVVDDNTTNNTMTKKVSVACIPASRKPLFEHFSASSCGTCPVLSEAMDAFCNNNPGTFTYVKYMMNWPPPGDPYYTQEGNIRKTYYDVNQIPWLFMDSYDCGVNAPSQALFNEHLNESATMEIGGSFYTDGSMIHINAEIMPYASLDDVRVYVSVNEKITHNNATTNGETSFHHVMMKMLPGGQGATMSLKAGHLERLTFDYDMSSTHVEEMDDLEVAVWIQRHETKRVYNSGFLFETENHPYHPENLTVEKTGNTIQASWEAPSLVTPTGYNIWLNEDLIAENFNGTNYNFNGTDGDYYCVQVQAVYPNNIVSVKAVATTNEYWTTGELDCEMLSVYPNPADGVLHVETFPETSLATCQMSIMNIHGKLFKTCVLNNNQIYVGDLPNGVYFIEIKENNDARKIARVIINHK